MRISKKILRMHKKYFIILASVITAMILFFIIETGGYFTKSGVKTVNIESGQSFSQIVKNLSENDVINSEFTFKAYARLFYSGKLSEVKSGEAIFNGKTSYNKVMRLLLSNERTRDDIPVTIPEGYELREIADLLEKKGLIDKNKFYNVVKNYDFDYPYIKNIEKSETRLEGFLFPDTYMFSMINDDEVTIIKKMIARFDEIYKKYKSSESKYKYSTYEIITLASIIEREGGNRAEFYNVSSVFHNRLKRNDNLSYLQSCATVQYILKERKKVLSVADTEINSPYNTYKNPGLPKGPIASPGEEAIKAALNPNNTNYLYFLNDKDGKLHFSKTFNEHQQKVGKYVN